MKKVDFLRILFLISIIVIPLSQFYAIRLILITAVYSFVINKNILRNLKNQSWDISFFLSALLIGITYTENSITAWSLLETSFSFFAFPLIFSKMDKITLEKHIQSLTFFSIGLFIAVIIDYCSLVNKHFFIPTNVNEFINLDPIYYSYYLIFAISFGLYLLYYDQVKKSKGFIVSAIVFFFIMLMLTAGNTAFVSILLVLAFFILKFLTEPKRNNYKIVVFCLSIFFLIAMFYVSYFDLNSFEGRNYWERFVLWEAAIKATPNLLIGVGTGDYTNVLNDYYISHNLSQFSLSNYNAHNQFIQTLLSNGILGLVALLIMMIRPLVLSIRYQNPLGILVFFSFFIYGLTEVFLGRYQGVVFFALMHQSFIAYYHNQSKVLAVKES